MNKFKIIAVDLDGTVLNSDKKIGEENIKVFRSCKEKGIEIIPVTGRPISGLYSEYISALGCNYAICTNGAVAVDIKNNKEIINNTMEITIANKVIDVLENFDCYYSVFYKGYGYLKNIDYNKELEKYRGTPLYSYIKNTRRTVDNQREFLNSINHCDNIYVIGKNTEIRDKIALDIKNIKDIFYTCSDVDDVEIGSNCSKGSTLLQLAQLLGVEAQEIMAIGDSGNDVSMLESSGFAVAMGNASQQVKDVTDFITKSCNDNGVAYAINKFCL